MKKTYKNPEMEVIEISMTGMLAASPVYGGSTSATSGNLAPIFIDDFDEE